MDNLLKSLLRAGPASAGVNDTKTGFLLDLDKSKPQNKELVDKIKQYEQNLKDDLSASEFASEFGVDSAVWRDTVSDHLKSSIHVMDNYGIQLYVKFSKKVVGIQFSEKRYSLQESIEALQPRTAAVKLVLTPGVVGFNEKEKTWSLELARP